MSSATERRADQWALFALTWSGSILFHLAGNTRLAPEWGRGLLGATAVLVLLRPRNPWLTLPLAGAVWVNVWLEAPLLGNHWLLQGFLALLVAGVVLGSRGAPGHALDRLLGPARLLLLAFYAFAAFAKLNTDFFEPAVSCAVFYLRESAGSWGAAGLVDSLSSGQGRAVAVVVAAIELSIPVLLVLRRTRRVGVLVALAFHLVLALDRSHQFFDFSSVLAVLFLLFLPAADRVAIVERVQGWSRALSRRWESGPELLGWFAWAVLAGVVVFASAPGEWSAPRDLREAGVFTWIALGGLLLFLVAGAVRSGTAPVDERLLDRAAPRWLLVIPALALLNGLTPYVELKSAYGWNMYANLAVVDGESNHLVVRRGFPVTDVHERLVRVVETTDPALEFYLRREWLLPEVQLIDYLAGRDGVVVEGVVDGTEVRYVSDDVEARPVWQQKSQLFRAVDAEGAVNCQPSFGPAR